MTILTKETRGYTDRKGEWKVRDIFDAFSIISKDMGWTITPAAYMVSGINSFMHCKPTESDNAIKVDTGDPYFYYVITFEKGKEE